MRLVSWNVNGIRAAVRYGFWEWLAADAPDVVCLQETRIDPGSPCLSHTRMQES